MPALAAVAATIAVATAATPVALGAEDSAEQRASSRAWSPFFEQLRPVAAVDARRVVVVFDDPSLGEWSSAGDRTLTPAQRVTWVKRTLALQQQRLDALARAGVQFRVEHRYVRVVNGASLVVQGDGAQLLRGMSHVALVAPVRTLWPAAVSDATGTTTEDDGRVGAAAAVGETVAESSGAASDRGAVRVAVLDTGIDASHPAVAGRVGEAFDATAPDGARDDSKDVTAHDPHGTAVAGAVLQAAGAGTDVRILPMQVLERQPGRDGVETVYGDSDDLLAALERAVDPDGDAGTDDAVDVAVIASTAPFAGFTGSAEDRAVHAADALGTLVVAAAGNDGASGDGVGTVGSVAASTAALAVGAADLRGRTPAADVRVHGGPVDETFPGLPVLTTEAGGALPAGTLAVVAVAGGGEVVDYLDAELRSRVAGAVALVATHEGVTIAEQVRAAADAGAIAVLVGTDRADAAAGTIDAGGADIPAIGIPRADARNLRDALDAGERLALALHGTTEKNPAFGTVAGFSSGGARLDGGGRPDVLAPGVGMLVADEDGGWHAVSGTSIAAAWAAGHAAVVAARHPEWSAATVRAALVGSAIALGEDRDRPAVSLQGAGIIDAERAAASTWIAASGRIDFGTIAPGGEMRRALGLTAVGGVVAADDRILLDDGGHGAAVTPTLSGDELTLSVGADAEAGHVGGWLVLPGRGIRIPWTATIGDAAAATVPLRAELTSTTLRPVAGPGAYASTMTLAIGGAAGADDSLGLAAVQRLELRLVDSAGKDRGAIGGLDQALPGIYTFGIRGVDRAGDRLKAGAWQLQVRYVPASDPDGEWRNGPTTDLTVHAARRAK